MLYFDGLQCYYLHAYFSGFVVSGHVRDLLSRSPSGSPAFIVHKVTVCYAPTTRRTGNRMPLGRRPSTN
jgi:hypothetical protein